MEETLDSMTRVEISLRQWKSLNTKTIYIEDILWYDLRIGINIISTNVVMPWEYAGNGVVIQFDNKKDAAWFILSYGGEVA